MKNYESIIFELDKVRSEYEKLFSIHQDFKILFINMVEHNTSIENDLEQKLKIIQKTNNSINKNIDYAKSIQSAMLPNSDLIEKYFKESFIYLRSKLMVSGDFYWFVHHKNKLIIAVVDCTGHGVPGSFLSVIGIMTLRHTIVDLNIIDPAEILNSLDISIRDILQSEKSLISDGMDVSLCVIDKNEMILEYSSALRPFYLFRDSEFMEFKGDNISVGGKYPRTKPFQKHTVNLIKGDLLYLFTDGFTSQLNLQKKQYKSKKFKKFLHLIHTYPLKNQPKIIESELNRYMESEKQTDDILIIGFKI